MGVGPVSEKLRKDVAPVGCRPTGLPASAMTPAGAPVPWLSQAMVLRRQPCSGAASLSKLLFPGPEWQSPQATVDGPDGLRYKGQGYGVCNTHPGYVPRVQDDGPNGVQRGAQGVYHLIDNHDDDAGRTKWSMYQSVSPYRRMAKDSRAVSGSPGLLG